MPRRSARLAARTETAEASAAANALAIPEILEIVIEQAFSYRAAKSFRKVNRLFRDATDKQIVTSIDTHGDRIRSMATHGDAWVSLPLESMLERSPTLWAYVKSATVRITEGLEPLFSHGKLVNLTLTHNVVASVVELHALTSFSLSKLTYLEIYFNSRCAREDRYFPQFAQ